ncbi:MAG: hypothetical protein ABGX16_15835 [Pirellulales bacterium]
MKKRFGLVLITKMIIRLIGYSTVFIVAMYTLEAAVLVAQTRESRVPEIDVWESKMISAGKKWGEYMNPASGHSLDKRLGAQYYDAEWVFYQIADYTGDKEPWATYASYAEQVYRIEYLVPNDYRAQGYRRFPEGLYEDFRRGGNTTLDDLARIRDRPAYSQVSELTRGPDKRSGYSESRSREVAYAVGANIVAEKAGLPRVADKGYARLKTFVAMMENHLWEWRNQKFVNKKIGRVAPFMMGLTAYALIEFYEWEELNNRNPNAYWPTGNWSSIDGALIDVFTWLYDDAKVVDGRTISGQRMWVPSYKKNGYGTYRFMDRTIRGSGESKPVHDVNQLIAPVYYWIYKKTGNEKYRDIGDQLFASAALHGAVDWGGKQFNQLYRLSFRSLEWRAQGVANASKRSDSRSGVLSDSVGQ